MANKPQVSKDKSKQTLTAYCKDCIEKPLAKLWFEFDNGKNLSGSKPAKLGADVIANGTFYDYVDKKVSPTGESFLSPVGDVLVNKKVVGNGFYVTNKYAPHQGNSVLRGAVAVVQEGTSQKVMIGLVQASGPPLSKKPSQEAAANYQRRQEAAQASRKKAFGDGVVHMMGGGALLVRGGKPVPQAELLEIQGFDLKAGQFEANAKHSLIGIKGGKPYLYIERVKLGPADLQKHLVDVHGFSDVVMFDGGGAFLYRDGKGGDEHGRPGKKDDVAALIVGKVAPA